MEVLVVKTINGLLKPAFDEDKEKFSQFPKDGYFEIKYTKKRNVDFHKKYFVLINLAFENQEAYFDVEDMRSDIIIQAGFYTEKINAFTGEITKKAKSIKFSSMDNTEFSELYEKTKSVICNWLGIHNESLDEEIQKHF